MTKKTPQGERPLLSLNIDHEMEATLAEVHETEGKKVPGITRAAVVRMLLVEALEARRRGGKK